MKSHLKAQIPLGFLASLILSLTVAGTARAEQEYESEYIPGSLQSELGDEINLDSGEHSPNLHGLIRIPWGWSTLDSDIRLQTDRVGVDLGWGLRARDVEKSAGSAVDFGVSIHPLDVEWNGLQLSRYQLSIRGSVIGSGAMESDPRGSFVAMDARIEGGEQTAGSGRNGFFALENTGKLGHCFSRSATSRLIACLEGGLTVRAGTTTGAGAHAEGLVLYRIREQRTGELDADYYFVRGGASTLAAYDFVAEEDASENRAYFSVGVATDLVDRLAASGAR